MVPGTIVDRKMTEWKPSLVTNAAAIAPDATQPEPVICGALGANREG